GKPLAVVARTVKGWGAPSIQGNGWHGKPPTAEALKKALTELDQKRQEITSSLVNSDAFTIEPPPELSRKDEKNREPPTLRAFMKANDMETLLQSGSMATRKAYGIALRALGQATGRVVVLDADVSNSTFAEMFKKDPACASRFIECKIAEQNMISVG